MESAVASKLLEAGDGVVVLVLLFTILLIRTALIVIDRVIAWKAVGESLKKGQCVEFSSTLFQVRFKTTPPDRDENRFEERRLTPLTEGRESA